MPDCNTYKWFVQRRQIQLKLDLINISYSTSTVLLASVNTNVKVNKWDLHSIVKLYMQAEAKDSEFFYQRSHFFISLAHNRRCSCSVWAVDLTWACRGLRAESWQVCPRDRHIICWNVSTVISNNDSASFHTSRQVSVGDMRLPREGAWDACQLDFQAPRSL